MSRATRKPAQPPPMVHVNLRIPGLLIERIDAIIAARIDGADRSSVIRELVVKGLEAGTDGSGGQARYGIAEPPAKTRRK